MADAGQPAPTDDRESPSFSVWRILIPVLLMMITISVWSRWYAESVSLPRHCEAPQQHLELLERILTRTTPAGDENRRPYLVAAKLRFLVPQEGNETVAQYLDRLQRYLQRHC